MKIVNRYKDFQDSCDNLIDKIKEFKTEFMNLPTIITDALKKKDFENKLKEKIKQDCGDTLKESPYNFKVDGLIGAYLNKIQVNFVMNMNGSCFIEWNDKKFDRNHKIETNYTTADGIGVSYRIRAGKIIDMIDSGRKNFTIKPRNSRVIVDKKTGLRYRVVVYRAMRRYRVQIGSKKNKKSRIEYYYDKKRNYKPYNPKNKANCRFAIPEGRQINVHGSRWSLFGVKLYDMITKIISDIHNHEHILGVTVDKFIMNIISTTMEPYKKKIDTAYQNYKYRRGLYVNQRSKNK